MIWQCYDVNDKLVAIYEYSIEETEFARLEIKEGGEHMITELVATLLLNRHALRRS
jgi:hypothetical protein